MTGKEENHARQTRLPLKESSPGDSSSDRSAVDVGEVLQWTSHPVKRKPLVSVAVTAFILLSGLLMYWSTESNTFTVLTLVILFASLAKFYFPTSYTLNREGVTIKTTTQKLFKPWSMYRSFYPDRKGILLSPFARPTRLENFRGLYIMCADNLDEVRAFVAAHISAPDKVRPLTDKGEDQ
jgi:hypothetical protein